MCACAKLLNLHCKRGNHLTYLNNADSQSFVYTIVCGMSGGVKTSVECIVVEVVVPLLEI